MMKRFIVADLGVVSELCKLRVVEEAASRLDDVFTLLWRFLHFACEEEAASSCHLQPQAPDM